MARKFWLLAATLLTLSALLLFVGCAEDDEDNPDLPGSLTVTSPAVGDNWLAGSVHNITWTDQNVNAVDIAYSINGGTSWTGLVLGATGNSYTWTIPNAPSTTCKIAMRSSADTTVTSTSGIFTISLPALVGTWKAAAASLVPLGIDSMRYIFELDSDYTMVQWVATTDIPEAGDYVNLNTATLDSIRFHVTSYDGTPADSLYTRQYGMPNATALDIEVYGLTEDGLRDTLYLVAFDKQ